MNSNHDHPNHDESTSAQLPPWQRPAEPDHPMIVEGGMTTGDAELMLRCMVEEYLLTGYGPDDIIAMCDQPSYQAFHAALHALGRQRVISIVETAAARTGRHRVNFVESTQTSAPATLTVSAADHHHNK